MNMTFHLAVKKEFPNSPRIPEFLEVYTEAAQRTQEDKTEDTHIHISKLSGHEQSVTRGFQKRYANWERDHLPSIMYNRGLDITDVEPVEIYLN